MSIYKWIRVEFHQEDSTKHVYSVEMDNEDIQKLKKYLDEYIFYNEMKNSVFVKPKFGDK